MEFRWRQIGAEHEVASAVRAAQGKADRILNEFSDGRGLLNRSAAAGESKKLLREIAGAQRSVLRIVQARAHFVIWREEQGSERDISDDRREEVVEIVRNSAGEQAELFQGLGFASLGFIALTFGDVAENKDHAGDFVLAVANGGGDLFDDVLAALARTQGRVFRHAEQDRLRLVAGTSFLRARLRLQIDRDIVNGFQRTADGFLRGPAGQVLPGVVDHDDLALNVGGDDAVLDGTQGNGKAFLVRCDLLLETSALGPVAHHGDEEFL